METNCQHCKWFYIETHEEGPADLECHRYAPRVIHGSGTGWSDTKWPSVNHDDYCGEWKNITEEI